MMTFTGFEYLLIDVANNNHENSDKEVYEDRIAWAEKLLANNGLEKYAEEQNWKNKPMFLKAVQAIRKAQRGEASGHLVGFDAVCSGMQIMSVLTGCFAGAKATGLVDQHRRPDAYTDCANIMSDMLGRVIDSCRKRVKNATMTALYGSKAEPKKEFGEDTPEHSTFWKALYQLSPGACELLEAFIGSWRPYALEHAWKLPDGFDAVVKVIVQNQTRIEVDELNSSLTYTWYENMGKKKDVKNAANVVHSIDAYVLRSLIRRCSYNLEIFIEANQEITCELLQRDNSMATVHPLSDQVAYYFEQYQRSGMPDVVIVPHLTLEDIQSLPSSYLRELNQIISMMLEHQPFDIVTVHDDFKCHPNHMNQLRLHYREILAEMADSRMIDDILSQLYGVACQFTKKIPNLSDYIRQSNYAIC